MFAEFELKIHRAGEQGETMTADMLGEWYLDLLRKYWGPDASFNGHRSAFNWARIPHFYYNYYVYQYATSFAASQMLSKMIADKEEGAVDAYMNFVKTGSSDYPIEILKKAGIDFTTTEPFDYTMQIFSDLVDQYEELLLSN